MSFFSNLPKAVKIFAAIIGALFVGGVSVLLIAWSVVFVQRLMPEDFLENLIGSSSSISVEQGGANATKAHTSISRWTLQCVGADSANDLPFNLRSAFSDRRSFRTDFLRPAGAERDASKALKRPPIVQEINVVQLSDSMLTQRTELSRKTNDAYIYLQYVQWLTILIGLLTTVVVSVSSTELFGKSDTRLGMGLRFLAIFLPAFGTAVAAINSFYNPRDDWNRTANALANISQLHGQIAVGIWSLECADKDDAARKEFLGKLVEWTKRYNDIFTIADSGQLPNKQDTGTRTTPTTNTSTGGAAVPVPVGPGGGGG